MIFKHFTNKRIYEIKPIHLRIDIKPTGALWISYNDNWIKWINNEGLDWKYKYVYEFDIDESKLITLNTYHDIKKFNDKYSISACNIKGVECTEDISTLIFIDWNKVKKDYSGIFVKNTHIKKALKEFLWYTTFDASSVAIFKKDAIISKKLLTA